MAKKPAVTQTIAITRTDIHSLTGTIIARTLAGLTIRNKKPRSSKFQDSFVAAKDVVSIYHGEDADATTVAFHGADVYDTVTGSDAEQNEFGLVQMTVEGGTVEINPVHMGTTAIDAEGDAEAAPAKKGGKKPAAEEDDEPAPKKGGKKPAAEEDDEPAPKKKAKAEPVEEDDAYEPEVGDRVKITFTDTDDEEQTVIGDVTKISAKSISIKDKAGEVEAYPRADVTVEPGPKKKKAAAVEEDDEPAPKKKKPAVEEDDEPAPKKKAKPAADEDDEPAPKKKGAAKAKDDDGEW
jgi:hypothetical protein